MNNNGNNGPLGPQSGENPVEPNDADALSAAKDAARDMAEEAAKNENIEGIEGIDLDKAADAILNEAPLAAEDEVAQLKAELAEAKDSYIRAQAEMQNLRKRTERELLNRSKFAISKFAESVLSVGDNIQRAIQAVPEDATRDNPALSSLIDGIKVTERELLNILERHDIKPLDVEGAIIDPNFHQAMYEIPNADVPAGTILQVVQNGYMIGDRVLRAAQVGVAKGGPKPVAVAAVEDPASATTSPTEEIPVDAPIEPRDRDPNDPLATGGVTGGAGSHPTSEATPAANDDAPASDGQSPPLDDDKSV